jgi:hypothetical protein
VQGFLETDAANSTDHFKKSYNVRHQTLLFEKEIRKGYTSP